MRPCVRWGSMLGSVLGLALALAVPASSGALAQELHQHGSLSPLKGAVSSPDQRFQAAMAEAMERMHADMAAVPTTGQPDRDFLVAMIPHHQGAIGMAKAILLITQDPSVRNLAQSIITEQQYEIQLMRTLLSQKPASTSSTPETQH